MFEDCAVRVIVCRIPVYKSVEHDCIEGESPIVRGRMECVILPFPGVVEGVCGIDGGVEVPVDVPGIISQCVDARHEQN